MNLTNKGRRVIINSINMFSNKYVSLANPSFATANQSKIAFSGNAAVLQGMRNHCSVLAAVQHQQSKYAPKKTVGQLKGVKNYVDDKSDIVTLMGTKYSIFDDIARQ